MDKWLISVLGIVEGYISPSERRVELDAKIYTVKEAAGYFNIGEKKLRQLMDEHDDLVLMVGSRKLIKRTKMER